MFKLVVLSVLLTIAVAKPSVLHEELGYQAFPAPVAVHALPAAVSHQSRTDIISKPVVATYAAPAVVAAPIVEKTVVAAPVVSYSTPALAVPAAVSHTSRVDIHSKPILATYAAPAVVSAPLFGETVIAEPALHAW